MIDIKKTLEVLGVKATNNGTSTGSISFGGGAEIESLSLMRKYFTKVNHIKPDASRKESVEGYVIALGFKGSD